jgi:hypothetical protein
LPRRVTAGKISSSIFFHRWLAFSLPFFPISRLPRSWLIRFAYPSGCLQQSISLRSVISPAVARRPSAPSALALRCSLPFVKNLCSLVATATRDDSPNNGSYPF